MTKYVSTTDLTTVIPTKEAVWQAANSETTPVALNLAPLTFDREVAPETILHQLYAEFLPETDDAKIATAVQTAVTTIFKDKPLSKFVTPDYTTQPDEQAPFSFSELFGGPTMSIADVATVALAQLANDDQVFVATDPEMIASLANTLKDGQELIGIYNDHDLPVILKTELAELQTQDNVQLFISGQPVADAASLLATKPDAQLIDQSVLLTQIPQIAAIAGLIGQANKARVNLVIPGNELNTVLAAIHGQTLGFPIDQIIVSVAEGSDLSAYLDGQTDQLAPDIKVNLTRLAAIVGHAAIHHDADVLAALNKAHSVNFTRVNSSDAYLEIRRLQTKLDYTAGFETATTTLAVPEKNDAAETIVLATVDPFVTPEAVLRGLTGRADGKVGFEAVQLLRQIVGAKPARLITHLKGAKPEAVPAFELDAVN